MVRIEDGARDELRDDADMTIPRAVRMIDGNFNRDIKPAAPAFDLALEKNIRGTAGAVKYRDAAVTAAFGQQLIDCRAQWREPEPTGDNDDVAALALRDWPSRTIGSTDAERIAWLQPSD